MTFSFDCLPLLNSKVIQYDRISPIPLESALILRMRRLCTYVKFYFLGGRRRQEMEASREKKLSFFSGRQIDSKKYEEPLWPFLKQRIESYGSQAALVNPYSKEEILYSDLILLVEKIARGLMKLGLKPGASLCIFAPNSVENALAILATIALGGIVHAPNPSSLHDELRRQMELSEARLIITVPELLSQVKQAIAGFDLPIIIIGSRDENINFNDLLNMASDDTTLPSPPADPSQALASLLFSSGTTGVPKGVQITQRNIVSLIVIFHEHDGIIFTPNDTILVFLPFFHVYGQVALLLAGLAYGVRLVIMSKFEMVPYLTFLVHYKATILALVPPVIVGIVSYPHLSKFDLSSVRLVFSGAAPLGQELEEQFKKKIGIPFINQGYGMTECMVAVVSSQNYYQPGSCGTLLPNTQLKIVDPETGKCLGVNETGELYMRGPQMTIGYHKNLQATQQIIDRDGWLHSGDLARVDSNGFVYVVDRLKELIKYKGEQVAPAVLEDILLGHPDITDACVIGKPDPVAGELPRAYVVLAPGSKVTEQDVKDFVAKNLPSYMQLRGGVEFRKEIPKNPSGKILRRILRDELKQLTKSHL